MNCSVLWTGLSFKSSYVLFIIMLSAVLAKAQADSSEVTLPVEDGRIEGNVEAVTVKPDPLTYFHDPKKATVMSALLPGLGQVYNHKYWKVPIIYAGFAVAGYYLRDNLQRIDRYKAGYLADTDTSASTFNTTGLNQQQLLSEIDRYKGFRDLAYISLAAIYVLNIIDANVDAHLFYFDVSEDISMNIRPYYSPFTNHSAGLTLCLNL